jgi:uncharacterized protein (TIGR02594 family)
MSKDAYRMLQTALRGLGYDPGPVDGLWGARTRAAVNALAAADGAPRAAPDPAPAAAPDPLPWMAIARQQLGLHEARDNAALRAFLASDGHALGDPAKLPWCGDFVETCIRLGLPGEPVPANPYFARNWLTFGVYSAAIAGAVVVFERGPSAGHVAFLLGQDATAFYCLGGNQGDGVIIARIARARALGFRWPTTWPAVIAPLPVMTPGQTKLTTNET